MHPPHGNIKMTPRNPLVNRPSPPTIIPCFILGTSPKSQKDICTSGKNKNEEYLLGYIEPMRDANGKRYAEISK